MVRQVVGKVAYLNNEFNKFNEFNEFNKFNEFNEFNENVDTSLISFNSLNT